MKSFEIKATKKGTTVFVSSNKKGFPLFLGTKREGLKGKDSALAEICKE